MLTCENCIHSSVCTPYNTPNDEYPNIGDCPHFKDKADYAPVVRCNVCKFFHIDKKSEKYPFFCVHHSGPMATAPNHFCNYGKRKGEK